MGASTRENGGDVADSGLTFLRRWWVLTPPYGYVIGILLWPVLLSLASVWAVLLQSGLPALVDTLGGLVVGVGGFVSISVSSALSMGGTAWNTPDERIRRQFAALSLALPLAGLLFGLYRNWPLLPFRDELGVTVFVAHELSKIVFLGPAIGFAFVTVPLGVLAYRCR
ncbi:hypothetical protein ACOZ4L_01085 [Haloplanus ruber]|uniref:Uncharacterized protein n=1 Tax=Haloplanus ruber TaxID=869892 RepID=A0ABD6CZ01_9EURY|nr:hypothetical protein [Haloplanus ruber]